MVMATPRKMVADWDWFTVTMSDNATFSVVANSASNDVSTTTIDRIVYHLYTVPH